MSDPALGHPAQRVPPRKPSAPPPVPVAIAADAWLLLWAGVVAAGAIPWWSFLLGLIPAAVVLIFYGRRAARRLGIRSSEEEPNGLFMASALIGILGGVAAAANTGAYWPLSLVGIVVLLQLAERVAWARQTASSSAPPSGVEAV